MINPGNWGTEELNGRWPAIPSQHLTWTNGIREVCVWVDHWEGIFETKSKYNIAVLIEPAEPSTLYGNNYQFVRENIDRFDLVFVTYPEYAQTVKNPEKVIYFSGGGRSYIAPEEWNIYPKTKNIASIMSHKYEISGHLLRHEIRRYLHVLGMSHMVDYNNPHITRKIDGTKDYRFEIAIENSNYAAFSEKPIDAMLAGCIPIYWTGRDTKYLDMFDKNGIFFFENSAELISTIANGYFTEELYNSRIEAVKYNFEVAKMYTSLGDILWNAGLEKFLKQKGLI